MLLIFHQVDMNGTSRSRIVLCEWVHMLALIIATSKSANPTFRPHMQSASMQSVNCKCLGKCFTKFLPFLQR